MLPGFLTVIAVWQEEKIEGIKKYSAYGIKKSQQFNYSSGLLPPWGASPRYVGACYTMFVSSLCSFWTASRVRVAYHYVGGT